MSKHLSLGLLLVTTAALSSSLAGEVSKDVVTVNYDVRNLSAAKVAWPTKDGVKEVKVDGLDGLVRLIVETVDPKGWRGDRFSIVESNGNTLEINTTKANHAEIADLLAALRRLVDVAVVAEAGLYAVDRAYYETVIAPHFSKNRSRPVALDGQEWEALRKASRSEKPNKVKLGTSGRGQVFSRQRAVVYEGSSTIGASKTNEVAFVGVRLEIDTRISSDRRFVSMNVTQRASELVSLGKRTTNIQGEDVPLDVPTVRKSSSVVTHSITVGDGVVVVVPPATALPGYTASGPVPLLFVRSTIWIAEEQKALEKNRTGK